MFIAIPWVMRFACVIDSWSWFTTSGCRTYRRSSSTCTGVWFETPKCLTLPALSSSSNARATSSVGPLPSIGRPRLARSLAEESATIPGSPGSPAEVRQSVPVRRPGRTGQSVLSRMTKPRIRLLS